MSATEPSQTVFSIGYGFHSGNGTANSGTDNGNVFGITNYKDTTHGRDQTFTYDLLNRLVSAQNAGTDCTVNVLGNPGNSPYSILTTRSPTLGNFSNTAGSCPGTINRGEAASVFMRSWACRLDTASRV
jgi:hypothetical protein